MNKLEQLDCVALQLLTGVACIAFGIMLCKGCNVMFENGELKEELKELREELER